MCLFPFILLAHRLYNLSRRRRAGCHPSCQGGRRECQWALTRKQALGARGGALQRGHRAPLEALAQLGDAHCSVCTANCARCARVDAAEHVISQAAQERDECQWALTQPELAAKRESGRHRMTKMTRVFDQNRDSKAYI